jgi:hypothetical protein
MGEAEANERLWLEDVRDAALERERKQLEEQDQVEEDNCTSDEDHD